MSPSSPSLLLTSIPRAFAWLGCRERSEFAVASSQRHSSASLIGLALCTAVVLGWVGWHLWMHRDGRDLPSILALVPAGVAAAMFRQLAHAHEGTASAPRRFVILVTAGLLLAPGAWLTAVGLPPLLFEGRINAHGQALAAQATQAKAASTRRLAQIDKLRAAAAASQRKSDELEPARMAWSRAIDKARDAASRCEHLLRSLRQSMPEPPNSVQVAMSVANLEVRATECGELARAADQITSRYEQGLARRVAATQQVTAEARQRLKLAERDHAVAVEAARRGERELPCLALPDCRLQRAVGPDGVTVIEAWGVTLGLLFLGVLPALLLAILPLDPIGQERRLKAIEDAVLGAALSDGARKAMRA